MSVRKRLEVAYGFGQGRYDLSPKPIVAQRAPTSQDKAELGTLWLDQTNNTAYTLVKVENNLAVWGNQAVVGTLLTDLTINPGPFELDGALNQAQVFLVDLNGGVLETAEIIVEQGTNAASIKLESQAGGILLDAATDANIEANDITLTAVDNVDNAITIQATNAVGGVHISAFNGDHSILLDSTGIAASTNLPLTLASSQAAPDCVFLHASNAAGSIRLQSAGDVAQAIDLQASAGGINLAATGAAGQDITIINTGGSVTMTASEAAANAIRIAAINAGGGIDIDAGTLGVIVDTTGAISLDAAAASNFTATGAFDVTVSSTAGSVIVNGGKAATDAVLISASSVTGGITLDAGVVPGIRITNGTQVAQLLIGTADPNASVTGLSGSLYIRTGTGSAATTLYVNTDAVSGTAWSALT